MVSIMNTTDKEGGNVHYATYISGSCHPLIGRRRKPDKAAQMYVGEKFVALR
jgi:hypothetical protein